MNVENTQSQMRKGILEYCILSILDKKEAYPSEILERLDLAQLRVVEGTIYPLLTRLKNMKLLESIFKRVRTHMDRTATCGESYYNFIKHRL